MPSPESGIPQTIDRRNFIKNGAFALAAVGGMATASDGVKTTYEKLKDDTDSDYARPLTQIAGGSAIASLPLLAKVAVFQGAIRIAKKLSESNNTLSEEDNNIDKPAG